MKIQKCRKKSHHLLTLWPWPLTYDLEKLIRSGHYHYQCVYQIWEQSIPWFFSYRVNTIAGGGRLRRKTITSPDPSDTGDINIANLIKKYWTCFHYQKLTDFLVCFPPSVHVQVRWPPSWKICLRIQLSFGFWGCAVKAFDNFSRKLAWLLKTIF